MVGGLAGICRVVFGTRWSGPAPCVWLNRLRVEMPARSQRCQRFMRPEIIAKSVQKSKLVNSRSWVQHGRFYIREQRKRRGDRGSLVASRVQSGGFPAIFEM